MHAIIYYHHYDCSQAVQYLVSKLLSVVINVVTNNDTIEKVLYLKIR